MKTRLSRTAKKRLKTAAIYLAALAGGVILYFVFRPYAMAHREIPELYGGELLFPIIVPFVVLVIRTVRADIQSGLFKNAAAEEIDE